MKFADFNFRIWHKGEKCYICADKIGSLDEEGLNPYALDDTAFLIVELGATLKTSGQDEPLELPQDIFVGDIVEWESSKEKRRAVAKFECDEGFYFEMLDTESKIRHSVGYFKENEISLKIVGNIHNQA